MTPKAKSRRHSNQAVQVVESFCKAPTKAKVAISKKRKQKAVMEKIRLTALTPKLREKFNSKVFWSICALLELQMI